MKTRRTASPIVPRTARLVALTAAGRKLYREAERQAVGELQGVWDDFTHEEWHRFIDYLGRRGGLTVGYGSRDRIGVELEPGGGPGGRRCRRRQHHPEPDSRRGEERQHRDRIGAAAARSERGNRRAQQIDPRVAPTQHRPGRDGTG